tara:strand:- start:3728 stop:4339 length:612 start_codon:yes stop_codon:yes gene_type:complete
MIELIENIECLWPKLDRAYQFDDITKRSEACEISHPKASYEIHIILNEEQAKDLAGKMRSEFAAKRQNDWGDWDVKSLADVFKKDETGHYRAKIHKKTYNDPSSKPTQTMNDGNPAQEGFQLTSGSKIDIQFAIKPWYYAGKVGVGLRPQHIRVIELAQPTGEGRANPFARKDTPENPFGLPNEATPSAPPPSMQSIDDEIPF